MKTLLVPTDFSKISDNAIDYAVEIARVTHAKLILFHAYHVPVITTEEVVAIPDFKDIERSAMDNLKRIERIIHAKHGQNIITECVCKCGFAVEEINLFTQKRKIDLIIMGMKGAGYLGEKLIGSVTTSLMQESICPVMSINEHGRFKAPKKIVLACDYLETDHKLVLKPLRQLANLFSAHVYVLNVVGNTKASPEIPGGTSDYRNMENSLTDVEHSFHYLQSENVIDGVNAFISERKMDMVVMIPRKHSILKRIFNEPNTKRMAFHALVPVLALHE